MNQLYAEVCLKRCELFADRRLADSASRATAEKLPDSTIRVNNFVASSRSIKCLLRFANSLHVTIVADGNHRAYS
jgi:hypothetical protein